MACNQMLTHVVRAGDTLYSIAKNHNISVEMLMAQNPEVDPYNLRIGTVLSICMDQNEGTTEEVTEEQMDVGYAMRELWAQHVYWTRMLLISIADSLKDQKAVTARLLRNPGDMAELFGEFYPKETAAAITQLFTEHLQIGESLMNAVKKGKTKEAAKLNHQWYINASQIAEAFSQINPNYSLEDLRNMLYHHLKMTTREIIARFSGNYKVDIQAFDEVEKQAMVMADHFTAGLVKQFPERF